jgi:hypothetical protein
MQKTEEYTLLNLLQRFQFDPTEAILTENLAEKRSRKLVKDETLIENHKTLPRTLEYLKKSKFGVQ